MENQKLNQRTGKDRPLYRAEQVRAMDRFAIDQLGIPGLELMRRAGQAAFQILRQMNPAKKPVAFFCGAGNNAGDAYVVARLAFLAGFPVRVYPLKDPRQLQSDAATVYREYLDQVGIFSEFSGSIGDEPAVLVDGLLGTGLDREVSGSYFEVIEAINRFQGPVLALDIPSGLNADSGCAMGIAVRADRTVTFIGAKQGLYTGDGRDYCGKVTLDSLRVPEKVLQSQEPSSYLLENPRKLLKPRRRSAHKGDFGHLLVIGGDAGFTGAATMAAQAGARVGAGLVSLATRRSHAAFMNIGQPELMCHGIETADELQALLERVNVVAVGPGLGQSDWSKTLLQVVLESDLCTVVDADGLNLLAENAVHRPNWVLTPHPGEAARLLHCDRSRVRQDRFAVAAEIQNQYGGVCVLKGAGTLVADGNNLMICPTGNPGMASGGMGDVLTGVIAGLVAQGFDLRDAARAGVYLHGQAADCAADEGERGLLASDLPPILRRLVNP